jgi:hypothetical protein
LRLDLGEWGRLSNASITRLMESLRSQSNLEELELGIENIQTVDGEGMKEDVIM